MSATRPRAVGSRKLKTRLGAYLRRVQAGQRFVVTDRGRPVAELRPLEGARNDLEARLLEMEARGAITLPKGGLASWKPLPPFRPIRVRGGPVSDTVIEDREDRV